MGYKLYMGVGIPGEGASFFFLYTIFILANP